MEKKLRDILQKCDNAQDFDRALSDFLRRMPQLVPVEFDKVFPPAQYPNTHRHMVTAVVQMQMSKRLFPDRDISINTDCTKFQILDLTMHRPVEKMKKSLPAIANP